VEQFDRPRVTRRALLGAAAAGLALGGCSREEPPAPRPPDPQTVLLRSLIEDKTRLIALYRQTAAAHTGLAPALEPFVQRHTAHLDALRRLLPEDAASPSAPASPAPSPSATASPDASLSGLRASERRAAAGRPTQMASASPALAQLLASIGACEAVHVVALGRLHD